MKKIIVSDVTLRMECETLKKALSFRERLNIATGLEKAGVDVVELPAIQAVRRTRWFTGLLPIP